MKLSSPYIIVAGVQLSLPQHVLSSTHPNDLALPFRLVSARRTSASPGSTHAYQIFLRDFQSPLIICNKSLGLALRRLLFFIHLFIDFINFNFLWAVQLRYNISKNENLMDPKIHKNAISWTPFHINKKKIDKRYLMKITFNICTE